MAFNYPSYGYQPLPYTQNAYYQQSQQNAYQQDGTLPARLVSGREEAVASNVLPGSTFLFYDRANNAVYVKRVDLQTGIAEFKCYQEAQNIPQTVQETTHEYVSVETFNAFKTALEKRLEMLQTNGKKTGKVINDDV